MAKLEKFNKDGMNSIWYFYKKTLQLYSGQALQEHKTFSYFYVVFARRHHIYFIHWSANSFSLFFKWNDRFFATVPLQFFTYSCSTILHYMFPMTVYLVPFILYLFLFYITLYVSYDSISCSLYSLPTVFLFYIKLHVYVPMTVGAFWHYLHQCVSLDSYFSPYF